MITKHFSWIWKTLIAAAALALGPSMSAFAQYPVKPVSIVVPFAAGGPTDILARVMADGLHRRLGQSVIIENKPGGGSNIGADQVARSNADGYTLLLTLVGTFAINQALDTRLRFNATKDFAPVAILATSSPIMVASPKSPARNFKDLLATAKARPGQLNFGSSGANTPLHLAGELLNITAGIKLVHVPYKGATPALNDLLGGQIDFAFVGTASALPFIRSGKLIAIGTTGKEREPAASDIPAIREFLPGYEVDLVYALFAPAGTDASIIAKIQSEAAAALDSTAARERLQAAGFTVRVSTPIQLSQQMASEMALWNRVVSTAGIAKLE